MSQVHETHNTVKLYSSCENKWYNDELSHHRTTAII